MLRKRMLDILPLGVRNASPAVWLGHVEDGIGVIVLVDIAAMDAGATLTVHIEGIGSSAQRAYSILSSAALSAAGLAVLKVYPALTAVANQVANDVLPERVRIRAVHGGTPGNITYSVAACFVGR